MVEKLDSLNKYIRQMRQELLGDLEFRETSSENISEVEESVQETHEIKLLDDYPDTWSYFG